MTGAIASTTSVSKNKDKGGVADANKKGIRKTGNDVSTSSATAASSKNTNNSNMPLKKSSSKVSTVSNGSVTSDGQGTNTETESKTVSGNINAGDDVVVGLQHLSELFLKNNKIKTLEGFEAYGKVFMCRYFIQIDIIYWYMYV